MISSISVIILLLTLFPPKSSGERGGCEFLQCETKTVMGEKHCARFDNNRGYCTCVQQNGQKVHQFVPCEGLKIFDLKKGKCVEHTRKGEQSCGMSGTAKKKLGIGDKVDAKLEEIFTG